MNETIYSSNTEQGLLRDMGPHKIYSTDNSTSGLKILPTFILGNINLVETIKTTETILVGDVTVEGSV
jgi:hypothetical protein